MSASPVDRAASSRTAPVRTGPSRTSRSRASLWHVATGIRDSWLAVGLSTEPADRATAEEALTEIYARHRRPRPRFTWVGSPGEAAPLVTGFATHDDLRAWLAPRRPSGRPPLAGDLAAGLSSLRTVIAESVTEPPPDHPPMKRKKGDPWPKMPADRAIEAGLPWSELIDQGLRAALLRSLSDVYLGLRRAAGITAVGWYGNQDAAWVAWADAQIQLGGARRVSTFDAWERLTRSAGWWFPAEDHCVLVERPAVLEVAPVPGAWHGEMRLVKASYRDGWSC